MCSVQCMGEVFRPRYNYRHGTFCYNEELFKTFYCLNMPFKATLHPSIYFLYLVLIQRTNACFILFYVTTLMYHLPYDL